MDVSAMAEGMDENCSVLGSKHVQQMVDTLSMHNISTVQATQSFLKVRQQRLMLLPYNQVPDWYMRTWHGYLWEHPKV